MTANTMSRLHRIRNLAYAPLVVAAAAGTVCTGAGMSSATTTDAIPAAPYQWTVSNYTQSPITAGQFMKYEADNASTIEFGYRFSKSDKALEPGDRRAATLDPGSWYDENDTWAELCYKKELWKMQDWVWTPGAKWRNIYVFADPASDRPFLTAEGAGNDIELVQEHRPC